MPSRMKHNRHRGFRIAPRARRIMRQIKPTLSFAQQFICAPRTIGSICPSSKSLTAAMVSMVPMGNDGLILDLGSGTGCVTAALLHAGVEPSRILAIENCEKFAFTFRKRYPRVPIIVGDACELDSLLESIKPGYTLSAVISSLPLRVIPEHTVRRIQQQIHSVMLKRGGVLIQYTYALWMSFPLCKYGFTPHTSNIIMKNIPPARVEAYRATPY